MDFNIDSALWCLVKLKNKKELLIGIVYHSPSSSDENNNRLLTAIKSINNLIHFSQVLLIGDFNVPEINWEDSNYSGSESSLAAKLFDAINDAYLCQHVSGFSRHRSGQRSSLLDLVFTTDTNSIYSVQHHSPLGSSDHECLSWQYECSFNDPLNDGMPIMYNYWKGNYSLMCQDLDEIDWESLFNNNSIDENWNLFKKEVAIVVSKHVPKTTKKAPTNKPPWWTNNLAKAIKQKQQLYSTFKHTLLPSDYVAYAHKRNEVKSQIRCAQAKYDQYLAN